MNHRKGFTIIEVVVVILVGAILLSIAWNSLGGVQSQYAVRSARDTFLAWHARTRAHAIERGVLTRLSIDPGGDSIWIHTGTETIDRMDFNRTMGIDIRTRGGSLVRLCMNARGFGEMDCNSFSNIEEVVFAQQTEMLSVQILPLGQVVY